MRIALDARTLYRTERRGIGKSLLHQYRALAAARPDWSITAYHRAEPRNDGVLQMPLLPPEQVTPRAIDMPGDRFEAWLRWRFPMAAWRERADLMHCPANHCPQWLPCQAVITLHDLIALDYPEDVDAAERKRVQQTLTAIKQSDAVITCPSAYTKQRIMDATGLAGERIHVIPWATDPNMMNVSEGDAMRVCDRYGLSGPYVIHFGSGSPRKNTRGVLEAWSAIKQRTRSNWTLLVVGLNGPAQHELARTAARLGIERSVRLTGFAQERDIPALLVQSSALLYPSFSEGFGLPILDAFAAGVPVITSRCTSLPEVGGNAAVYVDPHDPMQIGRSVGKLLRDPHWRNDLVQAGRERLTQYSWDKAGQALARVFETVANTHVQGPRLAA